MDRWRIRSRWPVLRRLAEPTALAMVVVCVLLPFFSASCNGEQQPVPVQERQQWRVTYDGVDILVGGQPDVARADGGPLRTLEGRELVDLLGSEPSALRPQPLAWLAVALVVTAMVATATRRSRRHAATVAGLLLLAALALYAATLLAREQAIDAVAEVLRPYIGSSQQQPPSTPIREWENYPWVRDRFRFEYGFWIAIGTLFLLGMVNVARAVPIRSRAP
jgi:hypothetical protein